MLLLFPPDFLLGGERLSLADGVGFGGFGVPEPCGPGRRRPWWCWDGQAGFGGDLKSSLDGSSKLVGWLGTGGFGFCDRFIDVTAVS
ncbi:hypothetical protein ACLB2K_047005 [Fragaria x ananassa]